MTARFDPSLVPALCRMSAAELVSLYRQRKLSPVEVTRCVLEQAQAINPHLNAFFLIDADNALAAAEESEARWMKGQPLDERIDGVPATIKNLVSVKGWPLRLGSLSTSVEPVTDDAPTTKSLRDGGAILVGATTTCEFGWKGVADSPISGVVRNPWHPNFTSGGSSGGAAIAAATGCGVFHLGSDGGGSIRIPAGFCGLVGHKPSFGRVPYFPPSAFGTVAHLGPIARTASDAALMLDVMSQRDVRDWHQNPLPFRPTLPDLPHFAWRGLRIGLWTEMPGIEVDPEVLAAVMRAATIMESLGAVVEPISLPGEGLLALFNILWFSAAAARIGKMKPQERERVDEGLLRGAELGSTYSAVDFANANSQRAVFGIAMDLLLRKHDLIISPTTPIVAFAAGHDVPPWSGQQLWTEWACFNFPLNLSQQPACSVSCGMTRTGLPIGLQIMGRKAEDGSVLAAVAAFAEARPQPRLWEARR
jgi:aspartyl-tRNA(Asn)/glutamyl-tRNA(Gln) amidotransferase subunit A